MATSHLSATFRSSLDQTRRGIGSSRPSSVGLVHLGVMDTSTHDTIEPVLSLTELAAHLSVSAQTLYDLRSRGAAPAASGSAGSCGSGTPRCTPGLRGWKRPTPSDMTPGEPDDPRSAENGHRNVRADPRR